MISTAPLPRLVCLLILATTGLMGCAPAQPGEPESESASPQEPPGQFEEIISYLVVGSERALLFDTGLGIGAEFVGPGWIRKQMPSGFTKVSSR